MRQYGAGRPFDMDHASGGLFQIAHSPAAMELSCLNTLLGILHTSPEYLEAAELIQPLLLEESKLAASEREKSEAAHREAKARLDALEEAKRKALQSPTVLEAERAFEKSKAAAEAGVPHAADHGLVERLSRWLKNEFQWVSAKGSQFTPCLTVSLRAVAQIERGKMGGASLWPW
jgi:hypothetical protein